MQLRLPLSVSIAESTTGTQTANVYKTPSYVGDRTPCLQSLSLGGTQKSRVRPASRTHTEKKETVWNRPRPQPQRETIRRRGLERSALSGLYGQGRFVSNLDSSYLILSYELKKDARLMTRAGRINPCSFVLGKRKPAPKKREPSCPLVRRQREHVRADQKEGTET